MDESLRILIVEDSEDDVLLLIRTLKKGGFDPLYERVETAEAMAAALAEKPWDLVLADYSLPRFSGMAAFALFQEAGIDIPFLIVSGVIGEETAVAAMKAGVHDYVMKGSLSRLVPAVERELQEAEKRRKGRRDAEALRESEAKFRSLFERARDGMLIADPATKKFLEGNAAICSLLGYAKAEIERLGVHDIHPPEALPRVLDEFGKLARGEKDRVEDVPVLRKDGTHLLVDISSAPITVGGVPYAVGIFRDTTERRRAESETAAIAEIGRAVGATLEIDRVYEQMDAAIRKLIPLDSLRINLINEREDKANVVYDSGPAVSGRMKGDSFPLPGTMLEETIRTRSGLIVQPENPEDLNTRFPNLMLSIRAGLRSVLTVPLISRGRVIGNLVIRSKKPFAYSDRDLHLAERFGVQVTGAITNARLFSKLKESERERQRHLDRTRQALAGTVNAIAAMVESRDPYTSGHQRRVADLARSIATAMGLSPDRIEGIRMASVVHDIGKISIPAEILSKPAKLSPIEYDLIKTHPQSGHDILQDIEFPWPIARMVREHHERMDGSGYPQGLTGSELLLESRIITLADVIEAMASHRPYRPGLGIAAALEEAAKNKGILYDPGVVDACLRLFNEEGYRLPN